MDLICLSINDVIGIRVSGDTGCSFLDPFSARSAAEGWPVGLHIPLIYVDDGQLRGETGWLSMTPAETAPQRRG